MLEHCVTRTLVGTSKVVGFPLAIPFEIEANERWFFRSYAIDDHVEGYLLDIEAAPPLPVDYALVKVGGRPLAEYDGSWKLDSSLELYPYIVHDVENRYYIPVRVYARGNLPTSSYTIEYSLEVMLCP